MPTCQAAYPNALTGKSAGAALGKRREGIEDNARLWPDSDQPKFLPSDSYRAESGPILARRTLSLREKRLDKLVPINALPGSKITQSYAADNTHQTHSAQTAPDTEAIWGEAAFSADAASRPKMTLKRHWLLRQTLCSTSHKFIQNINLY